MRLCVSRVMFVLKEIAQNDINLIDFVMKRLLISFGQ